MHYSPPGKRLTLGCPIPKEEQDELEEDLGEFPKDQITPSYILSLLKTAGDLDKLISKLEKLEVLGETPIKYWELDKIFCKLDIINPDITIKA